IRDQCLMQNAVRLDDYRSDAATVGAAVVQACGRENAALVSAIAGPDGYRESEIQRQIDQNSQQAATQHAMSQRAAMPVRPQAVQKNCWKCWHCRSRRVIL